MVILNNYLLHLRCLYKGFLLRYRPFIAINSSHLSGPYGSTLFSTTTYDVNDNMLRLDFGVIISENMKIALGSYNI